GGGGGGGGRRAAGGRAGRGGPFRPRPSPAHPARPGPRRQQSHRREEDANLAERGGEAEAADALVDRAEQGEVPEGGGHAAEDDRAARLAQRLDRPPLRHAGEVVDRVVEADAERDREGHEVE